MGTLNVMISPTNLLWVILVVRGMAMVAPHRGIIENRPLMNKRQRILGFRLSRNYLKQNFSKELRPALVVIIAVRVEVGSVVAARPTARTTERR